MKRKELEATGLETERGTVDEWLRRELEPSPERVSRIVRRALAEKERPCPEWKTLSWRSAAAVPAAVALLALLLILFVPERHHPPLAVSLKDESREIAATITNESGEVELRLPAGTGAGFAAFGEPTSPIEPRAELVNQNGLMIARVTEGGVRYIVIGGRT